MCLLRLDNEAVTFVKFFAHPENSNFPPFPRNRTGRHTLFSNLFWCQEKADSGPTFHCSQEDILKRLGQKHAQHDFLRALAQKVSYNLVSKDLVTAILGLLSDGGGLSPNLMKAAVDLLVVSRFGLFAGLRCSDFASLLGGSFSSCHTAHLSHSGSRYAFSSHGCMLRRLALCTSHPFSSYEVGSKKRQTGLGRF